MAAPDAPASLTVATFNVHMGVDGWGRPFDLVAECSDLDADVLLLQEAWMPDDGSPSTAGRIADRLGYQVVVEEALARGLLFDPEPTDSGHWGPRFHQLGRALLIDGERSRWKSTPADRTAEPGQWGIALLARVPVHDGRVTSLGTLRRDPAHRAVISCVTDVGGREVTVFGTHMSHISHWSPTQYRRLNALLPPSDTAAVLAGDMNLWGPPVNSFFPVWRRAVTGRTWPAHRPHSQLDHVLITPALTVLAARVAVRSGSDHRPVVVTLALA